MANTTPARDQIGANLNVHLYSICWNEAHMLGYFFRHYDPWVSRYVFYDDGSTDGTLDILGQHPRVEIRRFERTVPDSYVLSAREIHNSAWKESRGKADWVVLTAVDEHLYHPRLRDYLVDCHARGITLIPALGFQMISEDFPPPDILLCEYLLRGAADSEMNKLSLFRPNAIEETNFKVGRHAAAPTGSIVLPEQDELLLLHYKWLGTRYTQERHKLLATGLGAADRVNNWGAQYHARDKALEKLIAFYAARAIDIGDSGFQPMQAHLAPPWWRPQVNPAQIAQTIATAHAALARDDLYGAEIGFTAVLRADSDHLEALAGITDIMFRRRNYEVALETTQRALRGAPANPGMLRRQGDILFAMERYAAALASYERALELDPEVPGGPYGAGRVLMHLGRPAEALEQFAIVAHRRPNWGEAWRCQADALRSMGRHAEAIASYERALTLRADDARIANGLGLCLWRCGQIAAATKAFRRALELAPEFAEATANLAALAAGGAPAASAMGRAIDGV